MTKEGVALHQAQTALPSAVDTSWGSSDSVHLSYSPLQYWIPQLEGSVLKATPLHRIVTVQGSDSLPTHL